MESGKIVYTVKFILFVLIVPIRDGNILIFPTFQILANVLIVPIRDGNLWVSANRCKGISFPF